MTEPIRLLQITHDLAIGGLQQVVLNLCRTIDRNKFNITVLCLRALGPLAKDIQQLGIKVILLPQKNNGTDYLSFIKVAGVLKKEMIQVIHSHNTQPLLDGTMGSLISGGKRKIIHTDHARQFPDKRRYMIAECCMSQFVYKMVGVSEQTTENLRKYEKIHEKKLFTIENGIDGRRFNIAIDINAKRKELDLPPVGPVIGVMSRLEKVKGIIYLLRAMPVILTEFPDLTLIIVGEGSEMEQLKLECKSLGIQGHVLFTGARRDIPQIFKVLDAYVLPSLSEGLPLGLLEAMAARCPIVASSVGGIPGVVENRISAMLVVPANIELLAKAIIDILGNDKMKCSITKSAFELFNAKYSADIMANKYMELYC